MFTRMIDDIKESTGVVVRMTSLAAAIALALLVTLSFLCAAAFIYVQQNYGQIEACLTGAGIFFLIALIGIVVYAVRKRQDRRHAAETAKSAMQTALADPMVVAAGLQVIRAIGVKRLVPRSWLSVAWRWDCWPAAPRNRIRRPPNREIRPIAPAGQVTQRPGWRCLTTSVNTLTTGSQASIGLRAPDFAGGAARERLLSARGMRSRKLVAEKPSNLSETVRVSAGEPAGLAARSALAPRLTAANEGG